MAKVKLDNITRKINQTTIVENISFEIPDGELWVLVGPSGCGKSTILRCISGLESISQGNLYFDDVVVNQIPARQRDVAMVFQNYALYPHLTVAQNLGFGLKMRKVNPSVIEEKVNFVSQILNINHLLYRKPKQLSGGQQQRVALGRAIIRQPQVFLLDEPLSNLDAKLREQTRTELKKLHHQVGITTIYVTHDQVEAMTLGDRIVVLDKGIVQQIGSPNEIYNSPANRMVATFLGSPPMNIIPVSYVQGRWFISDTEYLTLASNISEKLPLNQKKNWDLGIRPEFITINNQDNINNSLKVIIDIIEPLGKEMLVRGTILNSNIPLTFELPINHPINNNDIVSVQLDENKIFFFDTITGARIN
ncbi:carbohydrate ABC transporter ATP-binding protein, CUT1 family [Cyanobacterium stanieri PCC 7202]|uniref:Carbohydrate ABC transporter ATP-binding protein, CUT1 family n=1 Tax=Cyanobacterium stanieri (strain ATCC 29140 / PCC 7202) TaxID=292563 RepID=K9YLL6_CYASC|nr:carbohydrate ABC transporter ATP-binding protein, CUT1 family [Cyanobacterium stanieri PCC 7202]